MDIQKVTRTASGMTGSKQIVLSFAEPQTLGKMVKGTAAGASQIVDKDGRILPRVGDVLDSSLPGLIAQSVDVVPVDSQTWQITASYNNTPARYPVNSTADKKPWELPPVIRWSSGSEQIVVEKCYLPDDDIFNPTGAIRLPNGRPYFDPPLVDFPVAQAHISWNTKESIIDYLVDVEFTLNAEAVEASPRILAAQTCYIQSVSENEELTEDGEKYYSHETTVIYRPAGHSYRPVSLDYYAIIDGKLQRVQLKDGKYGHWGADDPEAFNVTDPVYLDAAGQLLTEDPQESDLLPDVQEFQLYPAADWSVLEWAK
jgi:hypothetical protein